MRNLYALGIQIAVITAVALLSAWAIAADKIIIQQHPGYLSSVEGERHRVAKEVVIIPPQQSGEASLQDRIFDDELSKEFRRRYEDKFGRTQAEQFTDLSISSRFYEVERFPETNRTLEETQDEQEKFGSFMMKRLTEYHVDNYMKTNPSARPMYELKEKMSNMNVAIKNQYKLRFKYSLSSGDTDIYLKNPYNIDNRISLRGSNETALVLGYNITKTIRLNSDYVIENNNHRISAVKRLRNNWSTSLTSVSNEEEDKVLLGLNWSG